MVYNILSILIIVQVILFLSMSTVSSKLSHKRAYLWWPLPMAATLYALLMSLLYSLFDFPAIVYLIFPSLVLDSVPFEAAYVLISMMLWVPLGAFVRTSIKDDKRLLWPYFRLSDTVMARVGRRFYLRMLKLLMLLLALAYAVALIVTGLDSSASFGLVTCLPLLVIIPLSEAYFYLMADVPDEQYSSSVGKRTVQDHSMEELWQLYVDNFDNYSVAWRSYSSPLAGSDGTIADSAVDVLGEGDQIVLTEDLVSVFSRLEPLFSAVEYGGKYVLVALDIPDHFKLGNTLDMIADRISAIVAKRVVAFCQVSSSDKLENAIVVAPLSLLLDGRIPLDWLRKLGLITIVDIHDRGIANLYECREFSFILRAENPDCRLLLLSPQRKELQSAVSNTWASDIEFKEVPMPAMPSANHFYYAGYDTEGFKERFAKLLSVWPAEPLYPGGELAPLAVCGTFASRTKHIWPVHFLDVAYSNIVECMEEVVKNTLAFKPDVLGITVDAIKDKVLLHHLALDAIDDSQTVAVVYDRENNAPAAFRKWKHLGSKDNFTMVLSNPYLFRDYFNANHSFFCDHPLLPIQPHLSKCRVTLAIILFNMLMQPGKEESEIHPLLMQYYDEDEIISVPSLLRDLFRRYFSADLARLLTTRVCSRFDGTRYVLDTFYSVVADKFPKPSYLNRVSVVDSTGNVLYQLSQDLLFQNYDKGQIHSFNGRPYKIGNFSESDAKLQVSRVADSYNVVFYRACRSVSLKGSRTLINDMKGDPAVWTHETGQKLSLTLSGFETLTTVTTTAWMQFSKYSIVGGDAIRINSYSPQRIYNNGKVLRMTMHFLEKREYLDRKEDIRRGLQLLLHEALFSFFPHHAQYLIVASLGDVDNDLPWVFPSFSCDDIEDDTTLSLFFIEDANIDLGLIGALSDSGNIRYIFEYLYDYLCWLSEHDYSNPKYFNIYRTRPSGLDHLSFLRYGRDSLPKYLDIELLLNFIRDFFVGVSSRHDSRLRYLVATESAGNFECDFCGKEFKIADLIQLSDGRMRCAACSEGAIDTDEQFGALCGEAYDLFRTHLGIDFRGIPHRGNLVSAVELHRLHGSPFSVTRGYDVRKIRGFARDSRNDEFFVENGRKPDETLSIICHELTHIWQYSSPQFAKFRDDSKYWVEGLAVWTDLFLMEKHGSSDIEYQRQQWLALDNEYGNGLRLILSTCPDDPYAYIRQNA